jgi:outer membrane protein
MCWYTSDIKSKFAAKNLIMKNNFPRLLMLLTLTCAYSNFNAQKIAHLSFDSLVGMMPETKVAGDAAQRYLSGLNEESIAMQKEFETKYKDFMEKEAGLSELIKRSKQEDLQSLQNRIQDFQRQAEQDYRRKYAELTSPVIQKAKKGIELVAKEGGYKYVLDTSPQNTAVLYNESSDDILMLVKKKLDNMPSVGIPGANPVTKPQPPGTTPVAPKKSGK